jgi:hypothetical protein
MDGFGKKVDRRYLAVIGDVARSRSDADRPALQKRLERAVRNINERHRPSIASRAIVTLGDEFQCLLADPGAAPWILMEATLGLDPHAVRFGLGWGPLATPRKESAIGMDGPCFHHARNAVGEVKRRGRWARFAGFGPSEDALVNGVFPLLGHAVEGWTSKQREAFDRMWSRPAAPSPAVTRAEVARRLGIAPSSLSQRLTAIRFDDVLESLRALGDLLRRLTPPDGGDALDASAGGPVARG